MVHNEVIYWRRVTPVLYELIVLCLQAPQDSLRDGFSGQFQSLPLTIYRNGAPGVSVNRSMHVSASSIRTLPCANCPH